MLSSLHTYLVIILFQKVFKTWKKKSRFVEKKIKNNAFTWLNIGQMYVFNNGREYLSMENPLCIIEGVCLTYS